MDAADPADDDAFSEAVRAEYGDDLPDWYGYLTFTQYNDGTTCLELQNGGGLGGPTYTRSIDGNHFSGGRC